MFDARDFRFDGQVAVVTGADAGIGQCSSVSVLTGGGLGQRQDSDGVGWRCAGTELRINLYAGSS